MSAPMCESHVRVPCATPTDGRTDGRTYEESYSPHIDTSSSVTRARTYGDLVNGVLSAEAKAAVTILAALRRDPQAEAHRYDLLAELGNVCAVYRCRRIHNSNGLCKRHYDRRLWAMHRAALRLDVDDVVVDRLVAGIAVVSTKPERLEAIQILTTRGRSIADIAEALRTTTKSVTRYRAELTITNGKAAA